ncbi:hypothetical protein [Nonomuraea sp. NPDC050310]|uniref:DUF1648 domain-containing protein n=1 Tax=unclassified Nonomuraea TaxID=2593643 RepID=UPI0033C29F7D
MITVILVTCLLVTLPAIARPTLPFGVRVSAERATDPAVAGARRLYTRGVVGAGVLAVPATFWVPVGVVVAVLVAAGLALHFVAHRRIMAAKRAGGWSAERRQGVTVDTGFRTDPVRLPWLWALPAAAVLLLTAGLGWVRYGSLPATLPAFPGYGGAARVPTTPLSAFEPVLAQVAVTVVGLLATLAVLRARPDLDAARPRGSARRYRAYLRGVAVLSLLAVAAVNLSLAVSALLQWEVVRPGPLWQVAAFAPFVVLAAVWVAWEFRVGQAGHRLPALPGEEQEDSGVVQRDDDRHWFLAGAVYANRRDPAFLVHARIRSGSWTLNLGHPLAWVLVAGVALVGLLALSGVLDLPERPSLFGSPSGV